MSSPRALPSGGARSLCASLSLSLRLGLCLCGALLLCVALGVSSARAAGTPRSSRAPQTVTSTVTKTVTTKTVTSTVTAGTPVLVTSKTTPPAGGYRLNAKQVLAIASRSPVVRSELRRHPHAQPYEYTKGYPEWQVSWFSDQTPQKELIQVYVDDATGKVTQAWTGFQVAWTMARGYHGAFGRSVNDWFIWIPLCILFVAPFMPWRRRPTLLHFDLLMLLGFSISLAFFNHAKIGLSVPLVYPFLLYLLVRMLALGFGKGIPREPLRTNVKVGWLAVAVVFLMAFRIGLNVLNSNVIDVGYAGVIGATKLLHGHQLYGHWPSDNAYGDTYGPVAYYFYVPFRLIFGWSGSWDSLPASHAAAICFDVATLAGLFLLGRRLKGSALGIMLAYAWAAYPFTLFALSSNTNDALVAALITFSLLVITSSPARGVLGALAGLTKFAPFALAPLLARGVGGWPTRRQLVWFCLAFGLTVALCMVPVLVKHDWHYFWADSIKYQSDRVTPFSIYGLWGGLGFLQHVLQGAAVALAVVVAVLPGRRDTMQVAAFGAAVLIALQLTVNYWLYPYIVWFFPLVMVALLASHPEPGQHLYAAWDAIEEQPPPPAPAMPTVVSWSPPPPAN
ncbi:MAG TPA: hypothetical protein VFW09_12735 [Solirubrobacteraceae bacterium]|nr:hypothetical protein [Solirubrobacteraceae bacterium]